MDIYLYQVIGKKKEMSKNYQSLIDELSTKWVEFNSNKKGLILIPIDTRNYNKL